MVGKYSRAPITEAVIEIRVLGRDDGSLNDFLSLQRDEPDFTERKDVQYATAAFALGEKISYEGSGKHVGYQFWSSDKKRVFQARLDGFNFSRLAPYDSWETFISEAQRIWRRYRAVALPKAIERVSVRYINRLDLPAPADLKQYLRTGPEIAPDLPQELGNWVLHLEIPYGEMLLVLNEAALPSVVPGTVAVLLDIDLVMTNRVPQDETGLWDLFETLRHRKNEIFERSITKELRERIL